MSSLFVLAAILINLNRFWQYEAGYYDFGIFDVPIWKIAHIQLPIIDHFLVPGKINLADHFNPSIYLFAPLYWITSRSEVLFIAQDILVGLSGYILFRIGLFVLKSSFLSLGVMISYFLFTGLQNAVFSDFHELTVMTFFLVLTYWAILKEKKKLFFLFFFMTLGFKESLFLLGIGLSFFIYFTKKNWKRIALITFLISLSWGFLTIKVIIPYLSGGIYWYMPKIPAGLTEIIRQFYTPFIKMETVFLTFLSFLFLPLFYLPATVAVFINFASRFLSEGSIRWDLGLHYNAEIAPTLAVGSILGLRWLQKKLSKRSIYLIVLLLLSTSFMLYRFILHAPFGLAYNPAFYQHTKDFFFLDEVIKKIPPDASIATQNNLASRFLHQEVWILRENYKEHNPQYILMDLRSGQNPNNFLGIYDVNKLAKQISNDRDYVLFYHQGEQYIYKLKK